jgi:hypothetical protein
LLRRQEPIIRESDLSALEETMVREAELVREVEALDRTLRTLRTATVTSPEDSAASRSGRAGVEAPSPEIKYHSSDSSVPERHDPVRNLSSSVPPEEPGSALWRSILDQHAKNRALLAERRREVGERIKEVRVPRGARSVYRQRDTGSRIDVTR